MQGIKKDIRLQNLIKGITPGSGGSGAQQDVNDLIPQGVDDTSTAIANYGINIIDTVTPTDFCCRLPEPKTGKSVTIINKTSTLVNVFPHTSAGNINGNVNGAEQVSGPYTPYTFYCIENPLPGGWSVMSPLATSQIGVPNLHFNTADPTNYFQISHTNGVVSKASGWETGVTKYGPTSLVGQSGGVGACGWFRNNTLLNNPTFMISENIPTKIARVRLYTNITAVDVAGLGAYDIIMQLQHNYFNACNSVSNTFMYWQAIRTPDPTPSLSNPTQEVTTGVANTPLQVGDVGTLYNDILAPVTPGGSIYYQHYGQIGTTIGLVPGNNQGYWWCPYFAIKSTVPTQVFQFKIIIDIIQ
ncbi:hypothetical protein H8D85_02700 [bacterium]|nr:hypothetical protein [bacterium]